MKALAIWLLASLAMAIFTAGAAVSMTYGPGTNWTVFGPTIAVSVAMVWLAYKLDQRPGEWLIMSKRWHAKHDKPRTPWNVENFKA